MFVPPPPKPGLLVTVVAPYEADPSQRRLWETSQQRHREALERVPKLTDQREPVTNTDASLRRARERSRAFATDEQHRHIGLENRKLMGHLTEIVQKPSVISRMIEEGGRQKIPKRGVEAERRRQKEIAHENQMMVKRLLSVRTVFDRRADEKDYRRHQRDVERMKKINAPAPPRASRQPKVAPRPEAVPPRQLPQLPTSSAAAPLAAGGAGARETPPSPEAAVAAVRPGRTLPPLPGSLAASQSLPTLRSRAPVPLLASTAELGGLTPVEEAGYTPSGALSPCDDAIRSTSVLGGGGDAAAASATDGFFRKAVTSSASGWCRSGAVSCASSWPRSARTVATALEDAVSTVPPTPEVASMIIAEAMQPSSEECPAEDDFWSAH